MSNQASNPPPPLLDKRRLGHGVAAFAALTVAGLGTLFAVTLRGDLTDVVRHLSGGFLALAALSMVADILIGALRYQIFLTRIRPGTSLWLPIKADLANRFTGAVTPSQTGGGPAQVFVLWKGGIPVPAALSFLMINFISTLVFFLLTGSLTAWMLRGYFSHGAVRYLVQWGFVAFLGGLVFMLVGLVRPDLIVGRLGSVVTRLESRNGGSARLIAKVGRLLMDSAEEYRGRCVEFTREAPWLIVGSFLLTVVLYLNKFTLAWLVMRGLGADGGFGLTLAVQALLHFILYVAPTPGGSGVAELSTGALMSVLLPLKLLAPFTLAYRCFLLYVPAAIGGLVLADQLRPKSRRLHVETSRRPRRDAAITGLVLMLAALHPAPTEAQSVRPMRTLQMPVVKELAEGRRASEIERRTHLIHEALDRGVRSSDPSVAEPEFDRAVELSRGLVATCPDDADAHYLLAVSLGLRLGTAALRQKISMGNEVRQEAEAALALNPDHAGAHQVMGRLHAGAMRMSSIARFVARRLLGAEAMQGVSWERAEYHFRRAQEIEPDNPRHSMELGALYLDTGRKAMALEELTRAQRCPARSLSDSLAIARAAELLAALRPSQEGD
jgi:uncharacterized protein (TIRG00374 family)